MITTTLRKLKERRACSDRYSYLIKSLGGQEKYGLDTPLPLLRILDLNRLDDALWALRACDCEIFSRRLALEYALHTLHIYERKFPDDKKTRRILQKYLRTDTISESDKQYVLAVWDAAVWAEEGAEEGAEEEVAVWNAAEAVVGAAARAVAGVAAEVVAGAAAKVVAEAAARAVAGAEAEVVAGAAVAEAAARAVAGAEAGAEAGAAEREWQENLLRKRLKDEA